MAPCPLGYPDRFEATLRYSKLGSSRFTAETELLLYALEAQAVHGPCKEAKPSSPTSSWLGGGSDDPNTVKWTAWKALGEMNKMEAMRLFVRTVEEEQSNWYTALLAADASQEVSSTSASGDLGLALKPAYELAALNQWNPVPDTGSQKKPLPRYEHGSAMLGGSLYVIGGNYSGRYLNDVWKLDPVTMVWTPLATHPFKAPSAAGNEPDVAPGLGMPPIAGHSVTAWQNAFIILGGHTKPKDAPALLPVRVMDPSGGVIVLEPNGDSAPIPRGSHTATLLGSRIYLFGGEDSYRRPLNDLWFLDLESVTWSQPEPEGPPPPPRSAHSSVAYNNRYLLVFGGGSATKCHHDLYVLDTHSIPMKWFKPVQKEASGKPFKEGVTIAPRAGHSGIVVGSTWVIVGGGNNVKGCTDMLALDLSELDLNGSVTWHLSYGSPIPPRNPLSSEGVGLALLPSPSPTPTLISPATSVGAKGEGRKGSGAISPKKSLTDAPSTKSELDLGSDVHEERVVIAFGGYNGKYQGAVSVIKVPTKPLTSYEPQAPAAAAASVKTATLAKPVSVDEVASLKTRLEAAQRDTEAALKEASAAKAEGGHELSLLRKQISTLQHSLEEASKGLEETKGALMREREKNLRVEAEVAELKTKLARAAEVEKEVESLRRVVNEADAAKNKAGIWGYISGS